MSKLAILKELTDIKALAQRRSLLRRGAVIGGLAYLLLTYGGGAWSYFSTASRLVGDKVRSNVPLEFELERAKTMITGLIPDVRQNMLVIAQEEVGVEDLRKRIDAGSSDLAAQRESLVGLRTKLNDKVEKVSLGSQSVSKGELKHELTRVFSRYQVAEATLASQRQLLAARETALEAARTKLAKMLTAKRDLETQVESLQARLKTQQSETMSASLDVNDSQVAHCQTLLNEVRARIEVADRLFTSQGDLSFMTTAMAPPAEDIGEQIDRYFAPASSDAAVASVR
jgi:hypothetical protein